MNQPPSPLNPAQAIQSIGLLSRDFAIAAQRPMHESREASAAWRSKWDGVEFNSEPYCSIPCAQSALEQEMERLLLGAKQERKTTRIPLGLLLAMRGVVTSEQLQQALHLQNEAGTGRLGRWLLELNAITEADLATALGVQWGCPVFPLENHNAFLQCAAVLPSGLIESAGVLPVHHSIESKVLYLAFTDRVDHTLLYAIEQMTGCHAAVLTAETAMNRALERVRQMARPHETVFNGVFNVREMAATACNYAAKLQTSEIRRRMRPITSGCGFAEKSGRTILLSRPSLSGCCSSSHLEPAGTNQSRMPKDFPRIADKYWGAHQ